MAREVVDFRGFVFGCVFLSSVFGPARLTHGAEVPLLVPKYFDLGPQSKALNVLLPVFLYFIFPGDLYSIE